MNPKRIAMLELNKRITRDLAHDVRQVKKILIKENERKMLESGIQLELPLL